MPEWKVICRVDDIPRLGARKVTRRSGGDIAVFRTADRSNPVAALIGPIFGIPTVNVAANATAEASPANAMSCVKPRRTTTRSAARSSRFFGNV